MGASHRPDLRIPSHGEQLAAYVYRPARADGDDRDVPCVIMAHGFTGTRDDGLPAYAEAFQAAGFAVVVFDYRHFGASTGQPRHLIDIGRQIGDYRAVVAWARRLDGIDPGRVVLWGTSFSGGHVLTVAVDDARVAAVISQVPFVAALPTLKAIPVKNAALLTFAGLRDQAGVLLDGRRTSSPPSATQARPAAMTAPDAKPGFEALLPPETLWRNEFAARLMLRFAFYRRAEGRQDHDAASDLRLRARHDHPRTARDERRPKCLTRGAQDLPLRALRHLPRPAGQGRSDRLPAAGGP